MQARWGPGAIVGEYRLLSRLGKGGMAAVDLALHLPTGARRAIKSLPTSADPDLVLRFQREAEALARVDRLPGVVRVHAVGTAHDRHYLVMDHLPGGDLGRRLEAGPLAHEEAVQLGLDLARALAQVHARGILHRDLKPSNVLFDERGAPTLVDFGLARPVAQAQALTVTGELLGTPAYMAPEQARGERDAVDARTDVYGLGALLYHALTGHPPAEGRSALEALARAEQGQRPALRERCPGIPPALEQVVERALARRPDDRFASADELARALEQALGGAPARPRGRAAALIGVAVVAGAGLVLAGGARAPGPPALPTPPGPVGLTTDASPAPMATSSGSTAPRRPELPTRVEEIGDPPAELPDWIGEQRLLLDIMGPVGLAESLLTRARPSDGRVNDLAARLFAREVRTGGPDGAKAWFHLGELFRDGRGVAASNAAAVGCYQRALELGSMEAMRQLGRALSMGELGMTQDLERGRALLRAVFDAPLDAPGLNRETRGRARLDLGWAALEHPDPTTDREALEALSEPELRDHPEMAFVRAGLRARLGGPLSDVLADYEVASRDSTWAAPALRALVALHTRQGRGAEAAAARERLEALAARGNRSAGFVVGQMLVGEGDPGAVRAAAELFERVAAGDERPDDMHTRACRIELLRLVRRELAAGRRPPVSPARAEALIRREPDAERLLDEVR